MIWPPTPAQKVEGLRDALVDALDATRAMLEGRQDAPERAELVRRLVFLQGEFGALVALLQGGAKG